MQTTQYLTDLVFDENKPKLQPMLDTAYVKEVRITFRAGQEMPEHKAKFPICVQVLRGQIQFSAEGETQQLQVGDLVTLEGNVLHSLLAGEESVVRLSIHKAAAEA